MARERDLEGEKLCIEAWREAWGLVVLDGFLGFQAAFALRRSGNSAAWALADADGIVSVGTADTALTGMCGARAAARNARVVSEGMDGPGAGCSLLRVEHAVPVRNEGPYNPPKKGERPGTDGHVAMNLCAGAAQKELAKFHSFLDPDALSAMNAPPRRLSGVCGYNHFAGAWASDPKTSGSRRRQVHLSMPCFSTQVRMVPALREAVDSNLPLLKALAGHHQVGIPAVRALAKRAEKLSHTGAILRVLDAIPGDWVAARPGEAVLFAQAARGLGLIPVGPDAPERVRSAWNGLVASFVRRGDAAMEDWRRFSHQTGHAQDAARSLIDEVVLPHLAAEGALPRGWQGALRAQIGLVWLAATRSPAALLGLAGDHLDGLLAAGIPLRRFPGRSPLVSSWPKFSEDAIAPNGVRIRCLRTQAELDAEGVGMAHCVATYGWRCAQGDSHIFSLSKEGEDGDSRLSTLEIVPTASSDSRAAAALTARCLGVQAPPIGWRIGQHKARRNAAPCKEAREAASWFLESVKEGKIAVSVGGRPAGKDVSGPDPAIDDGAELAGACGYDWRSDQARADAWDRWRRLLGGAARRMSAAEFVLKCPEAVLGTDPECPVRAAIAGLSKMDAAEAA